MNRLSVRLILLSSVLFISGCTSFWQSGLSPEHREGTSSSLVDYLYPEGSAPPEQDLQIPKLDLPLKVGVAFVPANHRSHGDLSEATKAELLEKVKARFVSRKYIQHIEVIPETYLRSANGFEGMQQVARLYGVDVMALVSYDQLSMVEDTKASLLYWTIVGAYVVSGTNNEVQTFVDTAVFDVRTRRLLFRAPGIDKRAEKSTAVRSREILRGERSESFATAMDAMTTNLSVELDNFEERLKTEPQLAEVNWKGKGGGALSGLLSMALAILLILSRRRKYTESQMSRSRAKIRKRD